MLENTMSVSAVVVNRINKRACSRIQRSERGKPYQVMDALGLASTDALPPHHVSSPGCASKMDLILKQTAIDSLHWSRRAFPSKHLWSSGYDVSLTRWRSPVPSWPGVWMLPHPKLFNPPHTWRSWLGYAALIHCSMYGVLWFLFPRLSGNTAAGQKLC